LVSAKVYSLDIFTFFKEKGVRENENKKAEITWIIYLLLNFLNNVPYIFILQLKKVKINGYNSLIKGLQKFKYLSEVG
jgi:hypothetical protein